MEFKIDLRKTPLMLFSKNLVRIKSIQIIQKDLEKMDIHKKGYKIWFLNQTYHLHLVAYWQVYIQEQLEWILEELTEEENSNDVVVTLLKNNLSESIKAFSTPNKENIKQLFKKHMEIPNVTEFWARCGRNEHDVNNMLKNILATRNDIAHAAHSSAELGFDINYKNMMFLYNLAYATSFSCDAYLADIRGLEFLKEFQLPHDTI
ncbi:HEPN domain-containing protein [Aeromonas veronii]|uniref:hypothetical protein n=1 Tax=Aeromonas veronii TaxID=654 RepID=UPI00341F05E7